MNRRGLAITAALLLAAACGDEATEEIAIGDPSMTLEPVEPTDEPEPTPRDVTIAFAGDVLFEDDVRDLLDSDPDTTLDAIADALSAADVTMVNLETAITERGTPEPKAWTFRVGPEALDALAAAGVDVVSMANNHAVDYGAEGLVDTLDAASAAPLDVVGVGVDEGAAFKPAVIDVDGTTIAVLAASDVPDHTAAAWSAGPDGAGIASARDPERLLLAVQDAASRADIVTVYLHWGEERVNCPIGEQTELAQQLADAGADIVVGSHAHVLLGAGWLGSTYVSYGLGNFVWYHPNSIPEATSGVLTLTIRDGRVVSDEFTPTFTEQDGRPRVVEGVDAEQAAADWDALRDCAGLSPTPPE